MIRQNSGTQLTRREIGSPCFLPSLSFIISDAEPEKELTFSMVVLIHAVNPKCLSTLMVPNLYTLYIYIHVYICTLPINRK